MAWTLIEGKMVNVTVGLLYAVVGETFTSFSGECYCY